MSPLDAPLVLVTRPEGAADPIAAALRARGYRVASVPTVATEPVAPRGELDRAAARLTRYAWVVLTSAAGVRGLVQAHARVAHTGPLPAHPPHWAAIGPATARALRDAGVRVDAIPRQARGASIADALSNLGPLEGARVLLPRADAADDELPGRLRDAGAIVDEVIAYHTVEAPAASLGALASTLDEPALAAVLVASGSAVRGLLSLADQADRGAQVRELRLVSIGPSTSAVARQLGLSPAAEAAAPTPEALVHAVESAVPPPGGRVAAPPGPLDTEYPR